MMEWLNRLFDFGDIQPYIPEEDDNEEIELLSELMPDIGGENEDSK